MAWLLLQLVDKLTEMCSEGSPGAAKAAVRALVVTLGQEQASKAAADLADKLMDRLKASSAVCVLMPNGLQHLSSVSTVVWQ